MKSVKADAASFSTFFTYLFIYLCIYVFIYLFIYLFIQLFRQLISYPFDRLFVYLSMLRGQFKMLNGIQLVRFRRSQLNQGQNHPSCNCPTMSTALANCLRYNKEMIQYSLRVHQLAYCLCNTRPMRSHEGACLHFTTPHHHFLSVFRPLHFPSLPYSGSSQIDRIKITKLNHLQYLHKNVHQYKLTFCRQCDSTSNENGPRNYNGSRLRLPTP